MSDETTDDRIGARLTLTTNGAVDVDEDAVAAALADAVATDRGVDTHVEVRPRGDPLPEDTPNEDGVVEPPTEESKARFEVYEDRAGEFRWRLVHDNGNVIADSGEGYATWAGAENGLQSVKLNAPGAPVDRR
jgi:uncharacterized protein YegP (UPF0339 family)